MACMFTPAKQAAWEAERQEAYIASLGDLGNQGDESSSNMGSGGEGAGPNHDDEEEEEDPNEDKDEDEHQDEDEDEDGERSGREGSHSNGQGRRLRDQAPSKKIPAPDSDMETSEHKPEEEETLLPPKPTASKAKKGKQAKSSRKPAPSKSSAVRQARPVERAGDHPGSNGNQDEEEGPVLQASTKKNLKGKSTHGIIKIPARSATSRASGQSYGRPGQVDAQRLPAPEDIDMDDEPVDVNMSPVSEDSNVPEEVPTPYRNRAATADISMSGYRKYSLSIDAMNVLLDVPPVQYTPPPPSPRRSTVPGKPIDVLALRDQSLCDQRKNTARIIGPSTSSTHASSTQSAEKSSPDIESRTSLDRDEGFGEPTELLGLALGPFLKDWQPPKTGLRGHKKVDAFFAVERGGQNDLSTSRARTSDSTTLSTKTR
jgi:hypothetical protein